MDNFTDRLIKLGKEKNSRVIFELVPSEGSIPSFYGEKYESLGARLFAYGIDVIKNVKDLVPAIMLSRAAFEFYGIDGIMAFSMLTHYAAEAEIPVIIDGCFGGTGDDILKYAGSCFYTGAGVQDNRWYADAITVSPYAGSEVLKKLARLCDEEGKAAFLVARPSGSGAEDDVENVKTGDGETLYEVAFDDAGAFGEPYIGENGYSVLGTMTVPQPDLIKLRGVDRWGIALVCAKPADVDKEYTYDLFYPGEGEGEFLVLSENDVVAELGTGTADAETIAGLLEKLVKKSEEKRRAR